MNKRKIINDPVYGFITIPSNLVFDLIEHPYVQRLRYIKQLGMTHLVYPGALHTRFHHALGAMHLMRLSIEVLRQKGHEITAGEEEGITIAILLHDIGHGPFSHALEHTLVEGIPHEHISIMLMNKLNSQFNGQLTTAISIFKGEYHKGFLHELVSSQLDMDRLDYLNRDSFFTGVTEGVISSDRIIKMLDVKDGHIVVEEKGLYSVEKFLIARRLMYWQVYLHKTVLAAELMLVKILQRSRQLVADGVILFATPALSYLLTNNVTDEAAMLLDQNLEIFTRLDDTDIMSAIKVWALSDDFVLAKLCSDFVHRKLLYVDMSNEPVHTQHAEHLVEQAVKKYGISAAEARYFVFTESVRNDAYRPGDGNIRILMKNGSIKDIAEASDNSNLSALAKTVEKYVLCYSRDLMD